jgi:primosomal protein N' (replication factor Y)
VIADVVFDAPVAHAFSYVVPSGWSIAPGQRVTAPLKGAPRVGLVVGVREDTETHLKPLAAAIDDAPILGASQLDLLRWIAAQSLSSLGSTAAALLPPPGPTGASHEGQRGRTPVVSARVASRPELLLGTGRERRLLDALGQGSGLVLTPDVESATRWTKRLATAYGASAIVRVDSGASDGARTRAWGALQEGRARVAVGTRSALLLPLPAGATLAVVDEHEAAHKPPGAPRMHTREIALERGRREGLRVLLTSATPSVEVWWRVSSGAITADTPASVPWPPVTVADTRGILRREPLTPDLSRALRETLAAGRRALLVVSRAAASMGCTDCGVIMRCEPCGIALAYARSAATLACRLCGAAAPLPDVCPGCRGRRFTPFGWSGERVEHAVRRRFPRAAIARYDGEARGKRAEAQRAAAAMADVVVGTRGAVKLFGPGTLGLAAFVSPDPQLRLPDFRAAEQTFALMWAVTERVRADGAVIVQSQNPEHYALAAVAKHDRERFYRHELKFRAELGYPPFRRLAVITVRGGEAEHLAADLITTLRGARDLTVYPAAPGRAARTWRVVAKGSERLPEILAVGLGALRPAIRSRGMMTVEVDPVEWQF